MLPEIIFAFLLGSIPTGYLLTELSGHGDIRKVGSGNIGATNVLRHSGKLLGLITLLIDIGKGFLALELLFYLKLMELGSFVWNDISIIGSSVVLGHIFSPWLKFRGGKGVATMFGVIIYLGTGYINIFLITAFSWLIIVFFTRYVALGSVISLMVATIYSFFYLPTLFLFFILMTLLITYRHKDNFERIRNKTEHKISF